MKQFNDFDFSQKIEKSIEDKGFEEPTEIQRKAIPPILNGRDLIAESATGTGKTLAFVVGLIENYDPNVDSIQGLVLAPTRELAKQVSSELAYFSDYVDLDVTPIYGGVSIKPQFRKLKTTNFVVATPGRLLDHIRRGTIDLSKVNTFVLDEADRMLDMGFIDDVEDILKQVPNKRQTIFTSATIRKEILNLADRYMNNPEKVFAESKVDPTKLTQEYYDIPNHLKLSLLAHLLEEEDSKKVMVFCNTRRTVDFVSKNLKKEGFNAHAIHGGFSQNQRDRAMDKFDNGNVQVLVCTDVAARGLDIEDITHIYNYDIPQDSKQYMHRIGRTARAGEEGKAINILSKRDHDNYRKILRENDVKPVKKDTPYVDKIKTR